MKKWIMASVLIICFAAVTHAEEKGWTKEKYVKQTKKWAEHPTKGFKFNKAKAEAKFDELDTDGNGLLTAEEREAGKKNAKADKADKKSEKAEKAEESDGITKNEFIKKRLKWARNDPKWNPTKEGLESKFDEMDTDGDGVLTSEEQEAAKKKNKAAKKNKKKRNDA